MEAPIAGFATFPVGVFGILPTPGDFGNVAFVELAVATGAFVEIAAGFLVAGFPLVDGVLLDSGLLLVILGVFGRASVSASRDWLIVDEEA